MRRFARGVLAPYISACGYRRLCEIGSHEGLSIDQLLQAGSVDVEIIDPCIDTDLERKYEDNPHILVRKGRSLEVLPAVCGRVDCIMIDGDHNWYTVYQELKLIHERSLLGTRGTIFLHDVCWPYARRDMYYDPETIPPEYRQPMARKGILRGVSALSSDPRMGKNAEFWNAQREGGERNGVLTAVEDFLRENPQIYRFFCIKSEYGLGIITRLAEPPPALRWLRLVALRRNALEPIRGTVRRISGCLDCLPQRQR